MLDFPQGMCNPWGPAPAAPYLLLAPEMPHHDQDSSQLLVGGEAASPTVSCGGLSARAQLALMLLFAVAMGVQLGLMIKVAGDEGKQADAISGVGNGAGGSKVFCLVDSAVYSLSNAQGHTYIDGRSGGFSTAMTAVLAKGCTAYGGVIIGGSDPASHALQGMLCPSATMVDGAGRCKI
jgi:hypothetical protein